MPTRCKARIGTMALLIGVVGAGAGCSNDSGPTPTPMAVAQTEDESGDGQTAFVGEALDPLRVIVTRDGQPVEDVEVQWVTTGGTVNPGASQTDASGVATTTWTLGPTPGDQSASARVVGAEGSPVEFSANALMTPPPGGGGGDPEPLRLPILR
jgi:Bacterial Ig-like domain (group 1)